jgi:hypothetical protein
MKATGWSLEPFADVYVEAFPKECKGLLGLLFDLVLVDATKARIVCVNPKHPL